MVVSMWMKTNQKINARIVWDGEMKKLALSMALAAAAALLLGNLWMMTRVGSLREENNLFFATVIGNVTALYPDVDESQVIRILNDTENLDRGEKLLAQYGAFAGGEGSLGDIDVGSGFAGMDGGTSFVGLERQFERLYTCLSFSMIFLFVCLSVLLYVYFCIRQRKIENMAAYMEALNHDSYSLEIEDNTDDELSALRNEIYKLTVFLKERALRAAGQKKALADSVANISHQLKTPLTSITVLVDNLSQNANMDEATRRRFTGEISRQLSEMSWLVATMLKLSRLEAGVVALERERCSMKELVDIAVGRLETMSELAQVVITPDLPERIFLWVDRNWMAEALVNLLKNAIEHSFAGGKVEILGTDNDVYTELRITDHGTGITKEERERLFRRFYRGETAREDSVGIGLALAKEIVEKQNGRIMVDSEAGKGTVFSIRFLKDCLCRRTAFFADDAD